MFSFKLGDSNVVDRIELLFEKIIILNILANKIYISMVIIVNLLDMSAFVNVLVFRMLRACTCNKFCYNTLTIHLHNMLGRYHTIG